jgi:hypothetical protein
MRSRIMLSCMYAIMYVNAIKYKTIKYINVLSICTSKQVVEHVSPPRVKTSMKRVGAMTHLKFM